MESTSFTVDWYSFLYDAFLLIITFGGIWLLPLAPVTKAHVLGDVAVIVAVSLLMLHYKKLQQLSSNYNGWWQMLIIGILLAGAGLVLSHEFRIAGFQHGRFTQALANAYYDLDSGKYDYLLANSLIFGIAIIYCSIAGMIRVAYYRLLKQLLDGPTKNS